MSWVRRSEKLDVLFEGLTWPGAGKKTSLTENPHVQERECSGAKQKKSDIISRFSLSNTGSAVAAEKTYYFKLKT